jgi:hypothetical protein
MTRWETYAKQIRSLSGRLGFKHDSLDFLGYTVRLDSGDVYDQVRKTNVERPETLHKLLAQHSEARPVRRAGRLLRFADLPGGHAYKRAFLQRATLPIVRVFGENVEGLLRSAEALHGKRVVLGDSAVEIPVLPSVPLTYVLWKGDEELQPSASIFFDASASSYLPTEDLAVLAELTTKRLILVSERQKQKE